MDSLLRRVIDYRLFAFLVIAIEAGVLAGAGRLESGDLQMVLIADIVAFIGAQAWEKVKGVGTSSPTTGDS